MSPTMHDPPRDSFHLGQLIYDTRYRSLTIQTVAFVLLVALIFWLVSNTVQNLAALGRSIDFRYLGTRAGYDVNQRLISCTSDSTHARARGARRHPQHASRRIPRLRRRHFHRGACRRRAAVRQLGSWRA